jgi:hypothetical protein
LKINEAPEIHDHRGVGRHRRQRRQRGEAGA